MGVEYFWDLPTRSLSENDELTSSFAKKKKPFPCSTWISCDVIIAKVRVWFNRIWQSNSLISHNSKIQEKKGKSGKSKSGIKISRGRKNTSLCKLWFLVPFSKMKTSEEATRGLEAASFCCSDVITLIKRLKSNTFARWENASDRALVALIRFV